VRAAVDGLVQRMHVFKSFTKDSDVPAWGPSRWSRELRGLKSYSWNTRSADQFLKFVRDAALAVETQLTEIPHVALLEALDI
jgi:hypothetical protein